MAVIWSRFGPYHLARLRGAAEAGAGAGICVAGVEVAASDRDYAWARVDGAGDFERLTVFPDTNYHDLSASDIGRGVTAALERICPSAVAINGWAVPEARAAISWCRRHRRRAIVMSETKADDHHRPWWKEAAKRLLIKRFDAALVGGRPHADYLAGLGFPRDRIHYGYDVIDNAYFEQQAEAARRRAVELRRKLRLPETYFFACTRFLARKNIDGLLRAYGRYRQQSAARPWGLVIAGSGEDEASLHALADALHLHDLCWPGFVQYDELPVYYGLAEAFIHPAKAEPWGLVVNEAAASGLPLLVSKTVGARYELVRHGENGFLFDPQVPETIAAAMTRLAEMSGTGRTSFGRASQDIAADWSPEHFGRALLEAAGPNNAKTQRKPAVS